MQLDLTRITWEERDGVGIATLNRPERLNAIDTRTIAELEQLIVRINRTAGVASTRTAIALSTKWENRPQPGRDPAVG